VLDQRALNRALLARQGLLRRWRGGPIEMLEHLVGMQSQAPEPPYFGLWTRVEGFATDHLSALIADRLAVRIVLMRGTIHLVSARDCLRLRPVMQSVLTRTLQGSYGKRLVGIDAAELAAAGRAIVEERPLTFSEIGARLEERWPGRDGAALGNAVRALVPLVQVPPRGLWGRSGQARHTSVEAWLGQPLAPEDATDETIVRYLAAFGPASVRDVQAWSGLTRLREVMERLRPLLVTFRDAHGVELFDLPDAPRPEGDTAAPPRLLPQFDNVLLSHADRTRIVAHEYRPHVFGSGNGLIPATVLVDGFVGGTWMIARTRDRATLVVETFAPLRKPARSALEEEGARLLAFAAADAGAHDLRFTTRR
jgi:hypothetical protein